MYLEYTSSFIYLFIFNELIKFVFGLHLVMLGCLELIPGSDLSQVAQ